MKLFRFILLFCSVALLSLQESKAQQISYAEYFFDTDPGFGFGFPIGLQANDSVSSNLLISTNGLSQGFHTMYLRVRNNLGKWSFYQPRQFFIQPPIVVTNNNIVKTQFFIDNDPGFNAGNQINIGPADSVSGTNNLSVSGLTPGFHRLFARVKDSTGKWSMLRSFEFMIDTSNAAPPLASTKIVSASFFIDSDPGFNGGTLVNFTATDSISSNASVPLNGLTSGFHRLYARVKDSSGKWSMYPSAQFMVDASGQATIAAPITSGEYFYDNDPGQGNGIAINTGITDSIQYNTGLAVASVNQGFHRMFVRVRDSNGIWSNYIQGFMFKDQTGPKLSPKIVAAEYFINHDPGLGNAIAVAPSFTAADVINVNIAVATTGLSFGEDTLYLRVKDSLGVWSLTEFKSFKIVDPNNVSIVAWKTNFDVLLAPNPAINETTIYLKTPKLGNAYIIVYDAKGTQLSAQTLTLSAKESEYKLDISNYPSGNYIIEIINEGSRLIRKLVKN